VVQKPIDNSALIYAALTAHVKFLEAQNKSLAKQLTASKKTFQLPDIEHNDFLVHFYTGFSII